MDPRRSAPERGVTRLVASLGLAVLLMVALTLGRTTAHAQPLDSAPTTGPDSALVVGVSDCQGNVTVFGDDAGGNYLERTGSGNLTVLGGPYGVTEPWTWSGVDGGVIARFTLNLADGYNSRTDQYEVVDIWLDNTGVPDGIVIPNTCDGAAGVALAGMQTCSGVVSIFAQDSEDGFLSSAGSGVLNTGTEDGTTVPWLYPGTPAGMIAQFQGDLDTARELTLAGGMTVPVEAPPTDCAGVTLTASETCSGTVTLSATDAGTGNIERLESGTYTLDAHDVSATGAVEPETLSGTWEWSSTSTTIATISGVPITDSSGNWLPPVEATVVFGSDPSSTLSVDVQPSADCPRLILTSVKMTASETCDGTATISATDGGTGTLELLGSGTFTLEQHTYDPAADEQTERTEPWSWSSTSTTIATISGLPPLGSIDAYWVATFQFGTVAFGATNCVTLQAVPGATFTSGPALTSWSATRYDIFGRGTDGALWHAYWNGSGWAGWQSLGGQIAYGTQPAAVAWGPNRIDVFVVGVGGQQLWHKYWSGTKWSGWEALGGTLDGSPAVASWAPGRLDIVAPGSSGTLWHKAWSGSGWIGWQSLGGTTPTYTTPAITAWGPNRLDVFMEGTDDHLWHKSWSGVWSGWASLGGPTLLPIGPAAASVTSGELDVVADQAGDVPEHLRVAAGSWQIATTFPVPVPSLGAPALVSERDGANEELCVTDPTTGAPECGSLLVSG